MDNETKALAADNLFTVHIDMEYALSNDLSLPHKVGTYAVMLAKVPPMPGASHKRAEQIAVIACQYGPNLNGIEAWSWVHLSSAAKEMVGEMLIDIQAKENKWYRFIPSVRVFE